MSHSITRTFTSQLGFVQSFTSKVKWWIADVYDHIGTLYFQQFDPIWIPLQVAQ